MWKPFLWDTSQQICRWSFDVCFCYLGLPYVILSDNGSQFISQTMRSFTNMLSIAQTFSLRYHPQSNGVIENFHNPLKQMLANVTVNSPRTGIGTYQQFCSFIERYLRKTVAIVAISCFLVAVFEGLFPCRNISGCALIFPSRGLTTHT